ncbi:FxsA family protein [Candidatus Woesearchaeota archaeon]|nr:FxsA family protein [Candidatus Woesearchaeota archaeon]
MNTTQGLLLAVVSLPVIEIYLLIQMISSFGFILTLSLLIGAACLGTWLLRNQGWRTWQKMNEALQRGEVPAEELVNGSLIAMGAGLLLLPGFMSDLIALICLLPYTRRWLAGHLLESNAFESFRRAGDTPKNPQQYIDGEFSRDE